MSADTVSAGIAKTSRRPLSRAQIETLAARSCAILGLAFGAQTLPVMLGQLDAMKPVWFWIMAVAVFGSLLVNVVAAAMKRYLRTANTLVAWSWLVMMCCWPLAMSDPDAVAPDRPWLWFLCTVATAASAIVFTVRWATVYLLAAALAYGIVRVLPSGGGATIDLAAIDATYAMILGGALLMIITLFREAAASVDAAQATALARYSRAVRQHATEVERVHVDAIVHDSVLTTLLEAARADTPRSKALASTMAAMAIGQLQESQGSVGDGAAIPLPDVARRLEQAVSAMTTPVTIRVRALDGGSMPVAKAEVLLSATMQAMVNSLQHAGDGVTRWLTVAGLGTDGIRIEVGDTGTGFDLEQVPKGRLGLRVSIIERVAGIGGAVDIDSQPGEGTVITIEWPRAAGA